MQPSLAFRIRSAEPERDFPRLVELYNAASSSQAGHFHIQLIVDAASRRYGVGGRLYEDLLAFCQAQPVSRLTAFVKEDCPDGLQFAARRGFHETGFRVEMVLDLERFDEWPFAALLPRLVGEGFHLANMAELGNTQDARQKLFELNNLTGLDMPGETELSWQTLDEFNE